MIQTQQELERLKTLQESYNDLSEELPVISEKIDNLSANILNDYAQQLESIIG